MELNRSLPHVPLGVLAVIRADLELVGIRVNDGPGDSLR